LSGPDTKVLPALRIGPLLPEHAGEALTVQRAAYVTEAQRYTAPTIPPLVETLDELRADLAAGVLARGAWLGPRLVGSVRGRVVGSRMEVLRFSVAPDVQGRGVGRALLSAVHTAAPQAVRTFWLVTGAKSPENLHLYTSSGYRIVGEITDAAGVGLVRMELDRPPGTVGARS
jgi:ribosomal protein S18 acetylase RimI-like enzyme